MRVELILEVILQIESSFMIKTGVSQCLRKVGIDTHTFLFGIFERNAKHLLIQKCRKANPTTQELLYHEDERNHYGDVEIVDKAAEYVLKSFTIDRIAFIKRYCTLKDNDIIIDLGDSNGIFLKSLGKTGISVNISDEAIASLRGKGMEVIKAHIEFLPFKTGSVNTILLFETLEHVPNPVALLNEIGRVCSDTVIVSIPLVEKTHIHPYNYDPCRPIFQHHIFEFNRNDFARIVTHTPFIIRNEETALVLDGKSGIFDCMVFFFWKSFIEKDMFCGCFREFYICRLTKNTAKRNLHEYPKKT